MFINRGKKSIIAMPSWSIHLKWAERAGVPKHIAQAVDKEIDMGEMGHDWILKGETSMRDALGYFYSKYGGDGVKAALLHGVLDLIDRNMEYYPREAVKAACEAWLITCGSKGVFKMVLKLRFSQSDIEARFHPEGFYDPRLLAFVNEIYSLVRTAFNDIYEDVKNDKIRRREGRAWISR